MKIRVVRQYDEFLQINEQWDNLLNRSLYPIVFLTHEWIDTWWKAFGEGNDLFILLVYDEDDLIAIAPFMITHGRHLLIEKTNTAVKSRKIEFIANSHSSKADLILTNKPAKACEAIVEFLFNDHRDFWDMLSLEYLSETSPTVNYLKTTLDRVESSYRQYSQMASPYVSIDCPWKDYFISLEKQFRKQLKSRLKRLEESGKVKIITYKNVSESTEVLEDVFHVASKSWKAKDGTAISSTPQLKRFYTDLAHVAAKEGWLDLFVLYLDKIPLAFQYCLKFNNKINFLKTEFDEDYRTFSIGHTVQWKALESSFETGLAEIDLLGSSDRYKKNWSKGNERQNIIFYIFNKNHKGTFIRSMYSTKDVVKKILGKSNKNA